jgi:hypothetical protein
VRRISICHRTLEMYRETLARHSLSIRMDDRQSWWVGCTEQCVAVELPPAVGNPHIPIVLARLGKRNQRTVPAGEAGRHRDPFLQALAESESGRTLRGFSTE